MQFAYNTDSPEAFTKHFAAKFFDFPAPPTTTTVSFPTITKYQEIFWSEFPLPQALIHTVVCAGEYETCHPAARELRWAGDSDRSTRKEAGI